MQPAMMEKARYRQGQRHNRPLDPVVRTVCCQRSQQRITDGYFLAFRYARDGLAMLAAISKLRSDSARAAAWAHPPKGDHRATPARWFGPYSAPTLRHLRRVFATVLLRFTQGYDFGGSSQPTQFSCLGKRHPKCRSSVLANASIYGTIRICPSLLSRRRDRIGLVVLHEMLHQLGQIRDQRDPVCRRGRETRCYGAGALRLVRHGRHGKALNNNDNLAQFAYFATQAISGHRRELST